MATDLVPASSNLVSELLDRLVTHAYEMRDHHGLTATLDHRQQRGNTVAST